MTFIWLLCGALLAASGAEPVTLQTAGPAEITVDGGELDPPDGARVPQESTNPLPDAQARAEHNRHATKFEAAVRVGLSLPFGKVTGDVTYFDNTSLNQFVQYTAPIGADVGLRIAGIVFVGAYFQYAPGQPNGTSITTFASDVQVGAEVLLHPLGIVAVDPWLGVGAGYEWFNVSPVSADNAYAPGQFRGWVLLGLQGGVDFALGPAVRLGPYVAFSLGQFDSFSGDRYGATDAFALTPLTLHSWLTFGVRLAFLP